MREPKFRGFSKETNNWHYGHGWFEIDYTEEYLLEKGIEKQAMLYTEGYSVECELKSMSESTGLKDKHGKVIFDGDILTSTEYPYQDDGEYNYHGVVEWGEEEAAYYLTKHLVNKNRRGISHGISEMLGQEDMTTFEIIGNIHEHSHLLEELA